MAKRCVVTGMGFVSSVGTGKDTFWKSLTEGKSGVSHITYFDTSMLPVRIAGEVKDFKPADYVDESRLPITSRSAQFAVGAAKMAVEDAGILPENTGNSRLSLIVGTTSPPVDSIEDHINNVWGKESPHLSTRPHDLASICPHSPTAEVSHALGFFDSASTVSTVCTSGSNAIGGGLREIRAGRKDIVLAGATESTIVFFTFLTFISAGLLAQNTDVPPEKIMRPFDKKRQGGVLSEGAAFVVLEELEHARLRGAHIYGEIAGYSLQNKTRGLSYIKRGMVNSIREALGDARMPPSEVDYICAHGVSSLISDKMETLAFKEVFGAHAYRVPVSSIKSMTGIPNSAAGPMELGAVLLSFQTDIIPPTINYENPDPECDLDYVPNTARFNRINAALLNNHGLDGANAVLIAKRYGD
ncbi:MAG: beta-ketoacyl-[acyl-carrier-protein] synthase family protein [Candidatus Hydrogenedentota bacterium]|nr:MAG: beta-ketoacyl-[acyl-carrier-protein] synthase family protein [Candidatus Hydrogenedentota bacterium]